ncbi:hypothetical protein Q8A73_004145 [Channa argus]|nr:hypothetical protein Q8A73_004145 [Channa argus]
MHAALEAFNSMPHSFLAHSAASVCIICYMQPVHQMCINHPQSLSRHPSTKDEAELSYLHSSRVPGKRLSVRLTGQMLLLEAGHSWLDPSCYASIVLLQAAVTAPTFPTLRHDKPNQTTSGVHLWLERGTQPPTNQPITARPATIADQRSDVTMRLWILLRYNNRSTDEMHALLPQMQEAGCSAADPCEHAVSKGKDAACRVHSVCARVRAR